MPRIVGAWALCIAMLLAAAGCGGGDDVDGPSVETGQATQRRSSAEVSAEATQRAASALQEQEITPEPAAGMPTVRPTGVPTREAARSAETPASEAAPTAVTIPTGEDYDPELNMYLFLSGGAHRGELTIQALAAASENRDITQVPVIIEGMRFLGSNALAELSVIALGELTGVNLGTGIAAWHAWMEWHGRNAADYPPPAGYVRWKANYLSQIDPAFAEFLMPWALTGRINPTEIVWGGVRKDGIPDLQNPPVLSPDEAEQAYLRREDRVFGVSINGEHRAYPLRIVNAHEMANDILGGEPLALAY